MVNELSKALSVAEMKVQYDVQCRKVLAQKDGRNGAFRCGCAERIYAFWK